MTTKLCAFALLAAGACMAATKITYDEIPNHLGPFGTVLAYRGFTVTTSDGKTHDGRRLRLESDHLRIFHRDNSFEDLPNFQVARIEIRQAGRFFHHIVENSTAWASACMFGCSYAVLLLVPPVEAYTAATAPFYLAADGIAFLVPPKVYEIVH
jgi:hypothetical protein